MLPYKEGVCVSVYVCVCVMVSIGQCLVGMDRPAVVDAITCTSDTSNRLILTVLCRVESTFEGGWMAFAVNNMDVQTPS